MRKGQNVLYPLHVILPSPLTITGLATHTLRWNPLSNAWARGGISDPQALTKPVLDLVAFFTYGSESWS